MGSDGTISDEENFDNDRVDRDVDDASISSAEDESDLYFQDQYINSTYGILNDGYRELDSDFFLKEPYSGIVLFFLTKTSINLLLIYARHHKQK